MLKDKKILIVGLGRSGVAVMEAALEMGAEVSIQDRKKEERLDPQLMKTLRKNDIRTWFGTVPTDMSEYDMVVLSPGVATDLDFVREAKCCGAEIVGELELAWQMASGHFVAITGTNGKTTTTTLTGEIFRGAGRDTQVVGNIGVPAVQGVRQAGEDTWLVTEVSSFQLETTDYFRPEISAILNLTPDHLNRHKTMENYGKAKAKIFMRQSSDQYCVANWDDKACFALTKDCPACVVPFSRMEELDFGAFVREGKIVIRDKDGEITEICGADELLIPGSHNLENALAAAAIGYFAGIDPEVIGETLQTFAGVKHRIELCGFIDGVQFVNDSKGTNTDAAIKAIEAMKENILLIAGGYDKKADFTEMIQTFPGRVKKAYLLGEVAEQIAETARANGFDQVEICGDMKTCVEHAFADAYPGDVVLLSPACASWDMYDNFEQRGDHFKQCVKELRP